MLKKLIKIATIVLLMTTLNCYSQQFPSPVFTHIEEISFGVLYLTWHVPPARELSSYNIYKNGALYLNTTDTCLIDTIPFYYKNEYFITAVYQNPDGESEPCMFWYQYEGFLYAPHLFSFENEYELLASFALNGNVYWEFTNDDSFTGNCCAYFDSDSINYSSKMFAPPIFSYDPLDSIKLSFWYKTPLNQGISDTLLFLGGQSVNSQDTIFGPLYNNPEWTYQDVFLPYIDFYYLAFVATSGNGNGIYIDDINLIGLTTHTEENMSKINELKIGVFPNPCSDNVNVALSVQKSDNYDLSILDMQGNLIHHKSLGYLLSGDHTFRVYISSYSKGVYLLKLTSNKTSKIKKIIIK